MIKNLKEEVAKYIESKRNLAEFHDYPTKDLVENIHIVIIKEKTDGNQANDVYVRNKTKALREKLGDNFVKVIEITNIDELQEAVQKSGVNPDVIGIIVQKPVSFLSDYQVQLTCEGYIPASKDIDSITSEQLGAIIGLNSVDTLPLTARGITGFLDTLIKPNINGQITEPKVATVIGRSVIVGKPMVMSLINRGYTVFNANSKTDRYLLNNMLMQSDVIISAVGKHGVITNNYLKPGAIVIDVGINRDENGKLCGDLRIDDTGSMDFSYTPVPGGVGKITSNEFYCKVLSMFTHEILRRQSERIDKKILDASMGIAFGLCGD